MTRNPTNMPWAVYRRDRLDADEGEVFVSGHLTAREAYDEACRLKADDPAHCYVVGEA